MAAMLGCYRLSRRTLISGFAASVASAQRDRLRVQVQVDVQPEKHLGSIPADFLGLGYEISTVSQRGLLSESNVEYVRLVRGLSPQGVIRIGGNTSDYASWLPGGPAISSPKATIVDQRGIADLGSFLRATGWRLIWGFNLGRGSVEQAVDEAIAVSSSAGDRLLAFEIGNEPDLFPGVHRPANYSYADYYAEYRRFKKAIRDELPQAPFAGPDVIVRADWLEQFASAEASDIKLLTYHYYAEGPPDNPASTIETLMKPSPILPGLLGRLQAASRSAKVPYRICEANSCFGGGKPGVSDTMAAALWGLDFLFTLARFDAGGVNMETGMNHLGFLSWYTPIGVDKAGKFVAAPLYQGMRAFSITGRGDLVQSTVDAAAGINVSAYATRSDRDSWLTIINKEASRDAQVRATCPGITKAGALRLIAPSLSSKEGVMLTEPEEAIRVTGREFEIAIPAASAALVRMQLS